jgi:hypothetical protein
MADESAVAKPKEFYIVIGVRKSKDGHWKSEVGAFETFGEATDAAVKCPYEYKQYFSLKPESTPKIIRWLVEDVGFTPHKAKAFFGESLFMLMRGIKKERIEF